MGYRTVIASLALTVLALWIGFQALLSMFWAYYFAAWGVQPPPEFLATFPLFVSAAVLVGLWALRSWLMRGVRERISEDGEPSRSDIYALFFARWSLRLGAAYLALFGGGSGLYYQALYVSWGGSFNFWNALVVCAAAAVVWWSSMVFYAQDASVVAGKQYLMDVIAKNKESRERHGESLPADARPNERV